MGKLTMATEPDINRTAYFLSLQEIAAWQLESPVAVQVTAKSDHPPICADLPALQRAAVWTASQTEALWDSLVRGFPVGAFFFAPYHEDHGRADFKLGVGCRSADRQPDFLLLDGQQRATAIALGFFDLWTDTDRHDDGPALWIDLAPPDGDGDERDSVFRLLTRSHPWGYSRDDPKSRLAHGDIRDALACFCGVSGVEMSAAKLPLRCAWPWDAKCPVPVALLLASAGKPDWRGELQQRLQALPMWRNTAKLKGGHCLVEQWRNMLDEPQESDKSTWSARLARLVVVLETQLSMARIPALILPSDEPGPGGNERATEARKDAVETLFVRVNSAGTPIFGEELIYSSLKAAWSAAPQALERLQPKDKKNKPRQIVSPARLVNLLWRLHAAFPEGSRPPERLPATPSVGDFRKAIREASRRHNFETFVGSPGIQHLFVELLDWVRLGGSGAPAVHTNEVAQVAALASTDTAANEAWRLPPTLAAQLFAGDKGLDILFIAAAWLKCLQRSGQTLASLTPRQRQRSLGFIVAIHWFAERPSECVARLWVQLRECNDLCDFFNADRFRSLLPDRDDGSMVMLPMVPPDVLEGVINHRVTYGGNGFPAMTNEFWKPGSNWSHFYGQLAPEPFSKLDDDLRLWLETLTLGHTKTENSAMADGGDESEGTARTAKLRLAWHNLLDKMWNHRPLIDYAQRESLARWFPDFDPTLPGQMEDLNRPWDYDHIHPSSHRVNRVPAVIREWHQSIGNLRAWPLELNRGDQADAPARKLTAVDEQTGHFGMNKIEDLLRASFIDEASEWTDWQASVPAKQEDNRYLALVDRAEFDEPRKALLRAITHRFCALYSEWYESLALGDLRSQLK